MAHQISDGSSLAGTSIQELSKTIKTNRNCVVQITNHSNEVLSDPQHFCSSGYCYAPPQPTIEGRTRDACSFSKAAETATGAVGVLTYQLGINSSSRLALMFSVPYDFNLYSSWFGLAIVSSDTLANQDLYKEMYYGKESEAAPDRKRAKAKDGITLKVEKAGWQVKATMSEAKKAIIHIEILRPNEGAFSSDGHLSHHHHVHLDPSSQNAAGDYDHSSYGGWDAD